MDILIAERYRGVSQLCHALVRKMDKFDRILMAHSPEESMRIFTSASPECVLLEAELRGADGTYIAEKMRRQQPGVKLILMTAYEHPLMLATSLCYFIRKPFDLEELKELLLHI